MPGSSNFDSFRDGWLVAVQLLLCWVLHLWLVQYCSQYVWILLSPFDKIRVSNYLSIIFLLNWWNWLLSLFFFFSFHDNMYHQDDAMSKGNPLGPLMENVFVGHLEQQLFYMVDKPFFPCYVDDTFTCFSSRSEALKFINCLTASIHHFLSRWRRKMTICYLFSAC